MSKLLRIIFLLLILSLFCFSSTILNAQFRVEPKGDLFGFAEEKPFEYYIPMRFNRVEGWFPAFGVTLRPKTLPDLSFSVDAGYGLKSEKARFNLGFEYKTPLWTDLKIGGKYFDDTFTKDTWIIGNIENSFAAFLMREDFQDHFYAKGFTFWTEKDFEDWLHFRLIFWSGEYESMEKKTDWSLLGGNKNFRENPLVLHGSENKLRLEFIWDKLDNPIFPLQGLYFEGALEKGGDFLGGDLDQIGIFLTGKFFQRSFENQRMVFQARYGYRDTDSFAPQHLMDLGGIGTLRGYRYKEFRDGTNFLFGSWQYYFNGDLLQKLPLQKIPFYSGLGLIFFAETGALWSKESGISLHGEKMIDHPEWKSDVGFSLSLTGDFIRIDFAKRLDRKDDTWAVTFRVLPRW